jgi:hypothetical protein
MRVELLKGDWLLAVTLALKVVGKASKQYGSVVTARRLGDVGETLNVKLFCCCIKAAKATKTIEANTNAIIALFSAGCIVSPSVNSHWCF